MKWTLHFGFLFVLTGCSWLPKVHPPKATITTPSGAVMSQTGDAQIPAKVSVNSAVTTIPLPAGTALSVDPQKPGQVEMKLSAPTVLKTETRLESATAPQAFTPPAPPTPSELAEGKARLWLWIGLCVGVAAGLFGLVRAWNLVMTGGAVTAGACAFGLFIQLHPIVFVIAGAGLALKIAGPYIWHTQVKPLTTATPTPLVKS